MKVLLLGPPNERISDLLREDGHHVLKKESPVDVQYLKEKQINFAVSYGQNDWGNGATVSVTIKNNLISGFTSNIYFDLLADTAFLYNNSILYKHNQNNTFALNSENDNLLIKNNIFANNKNAAIRGFPPYVKMDYNLVWQNQNDL